MNDFLLASKNGISDLKISVYILFKYVKQKQRTAFPDKIKSENENPVKRIQKKAFARDVQKLKSETTDDGCFASKNQCKFVIIKRFLNFYFLKKYIWPIPNIHGGGNYFQFPDD